MQFVHMIGMALIVHCCKLGETDILNEDFHRPFHFDMNCVGKNVCYRG